tara:strand:- start:797 stop:1627 length:831 start_codon:yes stop_codon:yes gene_type:complete
MPGAIFKKTCKALDIDVTHKRFRSMEKAQSFLDSRIDTGNPVGCQVGVFHLMYFPKSYRFHFNAHNLIVYGRENDNYLVSDPIMETTTSLTRVELEKVRFTKGPFAPKGHVYYPENVGEVSNDLLRQAIVKGIKNNIRMMIQIPSIRAGAKGIKFTAGQIPKWREKLGEKKAGLYLGQIVRMQEEIGTGGGGFRFLYAAFLEQAAEKLQDDRLISISEQLTKSGDLWRDSALQMAGIYKGRITSIKDFEDSANILKEISALEKDAFRNLKALKLRV